MNRSFHVFRPRKSRILGPRSIHDHHDRSDVATRNFPAKITP
jgi:hypothetical protein